MWRTVIPTYPEESANANQYDQPVERTSPISPCPSTQNRAARRPERRIQAPEGPDKRQQPKRRQSLDEMCHPRGLCHVISLVQLNVDIIQRAEVQIEDGVSNESKYKDSKQKNAEREEELSASTTDPSGPRQPLQPILKSAGRTLPVIPRAIPGVSMAPCLQTSFVYISRGAFAFAGAQQAARFRVGGLINHARSLKEFRGLVRREDCL